MIRLLKPSVLLVTMFLVGSTGTSAQDDYSKDGSVLWGIGAGYEWMPEAYSTNGFSINVFSRYYLSERFFCELAVHWGTHTGEKTVMQRGVPFDIADQRDCLMAVAGPGFDLYQSADKRFCAYARAMIGYGFRNDEYDNYQPISSDDGLITLGCKTNKRGIAFMAGLGFDWRFRRWVFIPAVDAVYVGRQCNLSPTVSVGYYF